MFQSMTWLPFLGRVLFALLFLFGGIEKFMNTAGTAGYINSKLFAGEILAYVVPTFEVLAAIALIVGFKVRWTALLLAIFVLLTAVFFHNYWTLDPDAGRVIQRLFFWKNLSLIGGLCFMMFFGSGPMAMDKDST